jgi:SAM-dependent methyltransferase
MSENTKYLKDHYNNFVYPPPNADMEKGVLVFFGDPTGFWSRIFPERKFSKEKLFILVAGCGTQEVAGLARANPHHDFVGIDLSQKSIDHQKKLIDKYNIKNVKLICNDFRKEKFEQKFDYIVSSGVIHHLEDPGSALVYFNDSLKDDGAIAIMVYGEKINIALNEVKKVFHKLNLTHDQYSIDLTKQLFTKLNPQHPAKIQVDNSRDMNFGGNEGVVDFCLHKFEKFFSIKQLIKLLDDNGLILKNLNHGFNFSLTKFFYGDPKTGQERTINDLRKLSVEDQLELGQILNWNDRKLSFICTKKINKQHSIIYNRDRYRELYCGRNKEIIYEFSNNKIVLKFGGNQIVSLNIPNNSESLWKKILDGQHKVDSIIEQCLPVDKFYFEENLKLLIENYYVDLSFNPFHF